MNVLDRFISAVRARDIDTAYRLLSNPSILSALEEYVDNYKDIVKHVLELYMIKHDKIIDSNNPIIQKVFGGLPDEIRKLDEIIAKINVVRTARTKDLETLLKEIGKYRKYLDSNTIRSIIEYKMSQELLTTGIDKLPEKIRKIKETLREYGLSLPKDFEKIDKMIKAYEELTKNKEKIAEGVARHLSEEIKNKILHIVSKYKGNIEAGLQSTEFITALELAGVPKPVINKARTVLQSKEFKQIMNILNELESESKLPPEELASKVLVFLGKVKELETLLDKYRNVLGNKYNSIKSQIITMLNNTIPPIAYYLAGKGKFSEAIQVLNKASYLGANVGNVISIIERLRQTTSISPTKAVRVLYSIE